MCPHPSETVTSRACHREAAWSLRCIHVGHQHVSTTCRTFHEGFGPGSVCGVGNLQPWRKLWKEGVVMAKATTNPEAVATATDRAPKKALQPASTDAIARRAYDLYLARGCEHGHD